MAEAWGIAVSPQHSVANFFVTHGIEAGVISPGNSIWTVGGERKLTLGASGHLMAIINVTPDSFSDGGKHNEVEAAVSHALAAVKVGATILDIGGESTRPGAEPVSPLEEQRRVLPVIEALSRSTDCLISLIPIALKLRCWPLKRGSHRERCLRPSLRCGDGDCCCRDRRRPCDDAHRAGAGSREAA